ncbi:MAG: hypothetical protein BMS9Abin05_2513 [Rhodothermia bacterium]|nr:MAG: hypothetical protein BMS9Abin05_2513 [Rhodothermia bacterium]
MLGKTISHYKILEKLGEGGMGVVYKAEDTKLKRTVALKFLPLNTLGSDEEKSRFNREAQAAAALNHPHIATVHEIDEGDGQLFIAMEYIDGQSLEEKIAKGPLKVEEAVGIAIETADGLQAAHERDIVHRDIKPANIMLTQKGQVKIMDFGLAKFTGRTKLTKADMTLGTAAYMSPEQAQGIKVDGRSDIFSLGVVLYEMLTGQNPFRGDYEQAVVYSIMNEDPVPVTGLRTGVPLELERIVNKLLEKNPDSRYQNIEELPVDLKVLDLTATRSSAISTTAVSRQEPAQTPDFGKAIDWKVVVTMMVATAIGAGFAVWLMMRSDPPRVVARFTLALPAGQELASVVGPRFAISPDGSRFAYIGYSSRSVGQIWIRELDQLAATPLPGTEGACCPAFSPDGRAIVFLHQGNIKVMQLGGGSAFTLSDSVLTSVTILGVDWGPDGSVYFGSRGLLRVASTGGRGEVVTPQDSSRRWYLWPDVLPNGKGALFALGLGETWTVNTIAVTDFATGEVRELAQGVAARYLATGHLVYVRADGVLLVAPFDQNRMELTGPAIPIATGLGIRAFGATDLAVSETGTLLYTTGANEPRRQVVWVTRDGVETPVDPDWLGPYESVALSPDGRRLAVGTGFGAEPQLWIKSLDTGPLTLLTFEGSLNRRPAWTADGQAVTFISDRGNNRDLYVKRADGVDDAEPVLDLAVEVDEGFWSPDGNWLIYRTGISGGEGRDIFAWRSGPDSATVPVAADPRFDERSPALSPDGRYLAYMSDESGRWEVYVRSFPDVQAGRWQISVRGGSVPAWSHSGRELFYRSGKNLMAVEVVMTPTFTPGQQKVLFSVAEYFVAGTRSEYDMTADDQRFVMIRDEEALVEGDLVIVQNLVEELKQGLPN